MSSKRRTTCTSNVKLNLGACGLAGNFILHCQVSEVVRWQSRRNSLTVSCTFFTAHLRCTVKTKKKKKKLWLCVKLKMAIPISPSRTWTLFQVRMPRCIKWIWAIISCSFSLSSWLNFFSRQEESTEQPPANLPAPCQNEGFGSD